VVDTARRAPGPPRSPRRAGSRRPPAGGGGNGPTRRRPGRIWRYRRLIFLIGFLGFTGLAGFAYLLLQAPLPPPTVQGQTTFLTDATGARLATFDNGQNRIPVKLSQVPPVLVKAILDTEDHTYFQHGALDPFGIVRAAIDDLRGHPLQGGSTIAQQYVKNAYVGSERTFLRKIKEAAVAVKLERTLTKQQILERYLNTIYFGRGAYGVEAAAQAYFGKDVGQIGLPEAAYLAALIRSPDTADASRNPVAADERRNTTLASMVRFHDLSRSEEHNVEAQPVASYVINPHDEPPQVVDTAIGTQYFVDYVRRVLIQRFGLAAVEAGGLRVRTTLDLHAQDQAYKAVYGFLRPSEPAGALVSVDSDGNVRAMVGGRDYSQSQVNLATGTAGGGAGRQAGSTFKPFLLAAAVHEGYSLRSAFPAPAQIVLPKANNGADYLVKNYEGESFSGDINLVEATAQSVNTVYAQVEQAIGPDKLVAMAHSLGVTSPLEPNASLVLGTDDVSVLEMTGAFSTFADNGVHIDPHVITQVTTADGRLLWSDEPPRVKVLTQQDVAQIDYCLQAVVKYGTGTGAAIAGHQIAGKTGTTDSYNDAWFIGYTPTLTTAVWMGYPGAESRSMLDVRGEKISGGTLPATIWHNYMVGALGSSDSGTFPPLYSFTGRLLNGVGADYSPEVSTTTTAPSQAPSREPTTSTTSPTGESTTTSSPTTSTTDGATTTSSTTSTTAPPTTVVKRPSP
jgi:penicillin-binding protein 1A